MPYVSPLAEHLFLLDHVVDYGAVAATGRHDEATPEMAAAILTEAARLCDAQLSPLQRNGDLTPAVLENGVVRCSPGFAEGYRAIAEGGWVGMAARAEHGGMDLPRTLAAAVNDMMSGACLSLQLMPLMTQGQIEALEAHASDAIKEIYLPKLISGKWSGTMNLTEPQAGSDVGAIRTVARPTDDDAFEISGQKIYISWADNDFTENVCHLVLARRDGAPGGTRGLSLFIVPKRLPDANGDPGPANTLHPISLEHKMGLHGSPTAVMEFDAAKGWLVGAPEGGIAAMFTMMNNARLGVGLQGIGAGEGAMQLALDYAQDRKQGRNAEDGAIIGHPDVRRMLAQMRSRLFAARAIAMSCAVAIDMAEATADPSWAARAAFLTPIAKAFGTDTGRLVADLGIQVHGGTGFIEQTGAAQFYRDVRVTAIYEGTNGIQAMDLVGRKLSDDGAAAFALIDEIDKTAASNEALSRAAADLRATLEGLLAAPDATDRQASGSAFLTAFATVLGAHFHLLAARADPAGRGPLAQFYIAHVLPEAGALLASVRASADVVMALSTKDLGA